MNLLGAALNFVPGFRALERTLESAGDLGDILKSVRRGNLTGLVGSAVDFLSGRETRPAGAFPGAGFVRNPFDRMGGCCNGGFGMPGGYYGMGDPEGITRNLGRNLQTIGKLAGFAGKMAQVFGGPMGWLGGKALELAGRGINKVGEAVEDSADRAGGFLGGMGGIRGFDEFGGFGIKPGDSFEDVLLKVLMKLQKTKQQQVLDKAKDLDKEAGKRGKAGETSSEAEVNQQLQKLSQELQQINQLIAQFLKAFDASATAAIQGIK